MPHAGSNQDIDFSGYVDEYRFIPLTPSLEVALEGVIEYLNVSSRGEPITQLLFTQRDNLDEVTELCRMGYIEQARTYVDGGASFRLTSKGVRYSEEKNAYLSRKDAWARMKRSEARRGALLQVGIALLSFIGGIVCAVVGGML